MSEPRQLPILFKGPMVRAILDGRKTQTRRPAKLIDGTGGVKLLRLKAPYAARIVDGTGPMWSPYAGAPLEPLPVDRLIGPYGVPGDLLYVRETWQAFRPNTDEPIVTTPKQHPVCTLGYQATDDERVAEYGHPYDGPWRPSIHMPKWAARLWLRVTDVNVQRLKSIDEAGAVAEGSARRVDRDGTKYARGVFMESWDSTYAAKGAGWSENPFVWVVTFERCEAPR